MGKGRVQWVQVGVAGPNECMWVAAGLGPGSFVLQSRDGHILRPIMLRLTRLITCTCSIILSPLIAVIIINTSLVLIIFRLIPSRIL